MFMMTEPPAHLVVFPWRLSRRRTASVNRERRAQKATRALSLKRGSRADWEVGIQFVAQVHAGLALRRTTEDVAFREMARLVPVCGRA